MSRENSRASSPAGVAGPRGSKLSVVRKTDGRFWSKEVVKALCQRLPGGRASVTARCVTCRSRFYPCLCALKEDKCERVLKPPRIIRLVERMNLGSYSGGVGNTEQVDTSCTSRSGWGNLRKVPKLAEHPGMVRNRALVSTFDESLMEQVCVCGHRVLAHELECKHCGKELVAKDVDRAHKVEVGDVIWRHGERYAIQPDNAKPWYQLVTLTSKVQLEEIAKCLDKDELTVGKRIPDVEEKVPQLCINVVYQNADDAYGDLEIAEAFGGFYVQALKHDGIAYSCGVRGGHKLYRLQQSSIKTIDGDAPLWLPLEVGEHLPAILRPPEECTHANFADDIDWPVLLQFHALPEGWKAVGVLPDDESDSTMETLSNFDVREDVRNALSRALEETKDRSEVSLSSGSKPLAGAISRALLTDTRLDGMMQEDIEVARPVTLVFMRNPWMIVARNHVSLRHEHKWEPNVKTNREDDYQLLNEWGLKSRMTPAQLSFCFKKLADTLKVELQGFSDLKQSYLKQFISKSALCVDSDRKLESIKVLRERTPLESQKEVHLSQVRMLFNMVPLHFLVDIQQACDVALGRASQADDQPGIQPSYSSMNIGQASSMRSTSTLNLGNKNAASQNAVVPSIGDSQAMIEMQGGRRDLLSAACSARTVNDQGDMCKDLHDAIAQGLGKHRLKGDMEEKVIEFLANQIKEYVDGVKKSESDKPKKSHKRKGQAKSQEDSDPLPQTCSTDGRLSFNEFVRVMLKAGITGSSSEDMRAKFRAVDTDGSGRLNLAEVLTAANRMQYLVRQARAYEQSQINSGRKISQFEIMREFADKHRNGDDLDDLGLIEEVTSPNAPSTVYNWHLSCDDGAWEFRKPGSCILWKFTQPVCIGAIKTRGHPFKNNCYAKRYAVHYSLDADLKWDSDDFKKYSEDGNDVDGFGGNEEVQVLRFENPITCVQLRLTMKEFGGKEGALRACICGYLDNDNDDLEGNGEPPQPSRHARSGSTLASTLG